MPGIFKREQQVSASGQARRMSLLPVERHGGWSQRAPGVSAGVYSTALSRPAASSKPDVRCLGSRF
jgi:hypothetical protein